MLAARRPLSAFLAALATGALAALLTLALAAPALAKEGMVATLAAPIGIDTPAGTELLVGMTVTFPDGSVIRRATGSPIYLKLTSREGRSTWALGSDEAKPGYYVVRIVVPEGGLKAIEIGLHGSTDLPIGVAGQPLVSGGITAATAQVAAALPPAPTLFPVASAAAQVAAAAPPATVPGPAPASSMPVAAPAALPMAAVLVFAALAGAILLAGAIVLALAARSRRAGGAVGPDPAREQQA